MSIFAGLKTAEVFQQGNYFDVGIYDVRVTRCLVKQTLRSGMGFIVELEILSSTNPKHPPGSSASWFQGMSKNPATALSAVKEFVIALQGLDPKKDVDRIKVEIDPSIEQWTEAAIGQQNIFAGKVVHLECFIKKTREKQTDFTVHRWSPFTGDAPAVAPYAAPVQPAYQQPQVQQYTPPVQPAYQQPQQYGAFGDPFQGPLGGYAPPVQPAYQQQPPMPPAPRPAPGAPPTPVWDAATQGWKMPS